MHPAPFSLPINGNKPERRAAGNLNGTEAAALEKIIGARLVIPYHYHMFEFMLASDPSNRIASCATCKGSM